MTETFTWHQHSGPVLDAKDGFRVLNCDACKFKHIVPIPTPAELEKVYRHDYYTREKPLYLQRHREDLDWWNLSYDERYDTLEELLPKDRRRILDIGSGPGFLLLRGKERGWATLGIEPSPQAAQHTRELGVEVVEHFLDENSAQKLGQFDAIHMSEVLEHLPDPAHMLKLAGKLLTPDGLAYVVVPNDYSPFQDALRKACDYKPWWVSPPHHINYFDFNSLSALFVRCGFKVELIEATFPIDLFLLMGDNYVGNDSLGRQCHGKRKQFERNLARAKMTDLKRALYQRMAELGIGREACVVGRRL